MKRPCDLLAAAFVLAMTGVTPSWGGPPNPTASDVEGNTAGGTGALTNVSNVGFSNTAFGASALASNTDGAANTAVGYGALVLNTAGSSNTAMGYGALPSNFIAEEVAAVYPQLVTRTADGQLQAVRYQELIPMLVNELQRQERAIERQERELGELRGIVQRLGSGAAAGR